MPLNDPLFKSYHQLLTHFGSQHWWPADTAFEVMIGAVLTQQSRWFSVEESIRNLKMKGLLEPEALANAATEEVEESIKPSGFYHQKAARIQNLSRYLVEHYNGELDRFFGRELLQVRNELLQLDGVGPETADSILLYAGAKCVFVVDAYTVRFCNRLGLTTGGRYEAVKTFFEARLPRNVSLYKEFHALIVQLGKEYCRARPLCEKCPLSDKCVYGVEMNSEKTNEG
jgi:endonuclease-3 related protein